MLIKNFRSVKETELILGDCTVLIGPNNVGKTAILDAIRIALTRRLGSRGTGLKDIHLPQPPPKLSAASAANLRIADIRMMLDEEPSPRASRDTRLALAVAFVKPVGVSTVI